MSNGKIAGIAIGTLAIGIAIGFFIPADSGIEQTAPAPMMQTESVDYGIDKITIGFIPTNFIKAMSFAKPFLYLLLDIAAPPYFTSMLLP